MESSIKYSMMKKYFLLFAALYVMIIGLHASSVSESEDKTEMVLSSKSLKIAWSKQADGWHINNVLVNGKTFPNPEGYYTILYLNRQPAASLVDQDLEGKAFTFFPASAENSGDTAIIFRQSLRFGEIEAIWKADPLYPSDIKVSVTVKMTKKGILSISTPTIVTFDPDNISWGMIPGHWYGNEVQPNLELARLYSMGIPAVPMLAKEQTTMTLSPLMTTRDKMTLAVIPDPDMPNDPWQDSVSTRTNNKLGMSIMNRHDELTPVIYSPILGQTGSKVEAGDNVSLNFRYTIQDTDWFPVFSHAVNDIYNFPSLLDLQHNFMSLSERVSKMQKYLRNDKKSAWSIWESRGYEIGANGSKIADAGTMYMIAKNGNDSVMNSRLKYVRNYKLAQQQLEPGFFHGAALGEYADEDGVESERGNWIEPIHTTYYTMVDFANMLLYDPSDEELKKRLRMAADRLLDWQHTDGGFDVGYDRMSYRLAFPDLKDFRPTWYGLLIAYRMLGDSKYLLAAEKGAEWLYKNGVKKGYYLGVCGDARNIWDFATAQCSQAYIDLYDITNKEVYKTAAIEAAKAYSTTIFTHPVSTGKEKSAAGIKRQDWEINQTGLGVEHIRGTSITGPILISSFTGLFIRIYEYTGEPVFLTMARAAARGRNTYVDQESGQAIYYWHSLENLQKGATMFPWHAYWQIGWITDYILSEIHLRSSGNIQFPYGFMTPKVGSHVTYGFEAGDIYGREGELIFRPDMVECDNADVEYMLAQSPDQSKLYLMVLSQSPLNQSCTMKIDLSFLSSDKTQWKSIKNLQGKIKKADKKNGSINFDFAPWDLNVLEISFN